MIINTVAYICLSVILEIIQQSEIHPFDKFGIIGDHLGASIKPLKHHASIVLRGLIGSLNWVSFLQRGFMTLESQWKNLLGVHAVYSMNFW